MQSSIGFQQEAIKEFFQNGPLGILISKSQNQSLLEELLKEATSVDIEVVVFFMDDAVNLLKDSDWVNSLPPANYSGCDLSAQRRDVKPSEKINMAGQYHNAMMMHECSHVVSM